jgi:hypothetical protein
MPSTVLQGPDVADTRVRFAPSPSGDLHVGNIRTAIYCWAYARRTGGSFIFRIEDTDKSRVTDEYIHAAIESMRWLGLDWDEGPEVGGGFGPYLQSQRMDIYREWSRRFLEEGDAYYCYCTPAELEERREKARAEGRPPGYDGRCRNLTPEQIAAYEAEGRKPVLRFRMPPGKTTFVDLVRGEVTFEHEYVPDFVLARADGSPLYTLAVAVDDVLMKITHVVRGEDLLSSTPRQVAVYRAMGVRRRTCPASRTCPSSWGRTTPSCPSATARRRSAHSGTRATCRRRCVTTSLCWGGRRVTTESSSRWQRWRGSSTWPESTPARLDLTCESSTPSTATGYGLSLRLTLRHALYRSCSIRVWCHGSRPMRSAGWSMGSRP